jgi:4-hydroxybenzoate polyprenyltransferase
MRAYLQLVRVPNVFTAMADVMLGFLLTHTSLEPWPPFVLLLAASSLLYLSGMTLNDYFDREQDARERPHRPIPSGRITAAIAARLGAAMLLGGTALGWCASLLLQDARPAIVATLLAAAIVYYDSGGKHTLAGPAVMGACRLLNVLLGMSAAPEPWHAVHWVVAGGVGVYIAGVTLFARSEARDSPRGQLTLGLAILLAGVALLASTPEWATGNEWPSVRTPERWYVFWGLIAMFIAVRCVRAVIDPQPVYVQAAVRNCIFALVILDAATVMAVQDRFWALIILALLLPMLMLGRWIYST